MEKKSSTLEIILRIVLAVILFSAIIKLDSILNLPNLMVDRGWSLLQIILVITLIRLILVGLAVIFLLPIILGEKGVQERLAGFLRFDLKVFLAGILSFTLFCILGIVLSLVSGMDLDKLSVIFKLPDLRPDPDVIGWGYFLIALVPGVWEELAFRGWIQSKLRKKLSPWASVILSSLFFSLFHFSNLVDQAPIQVILGVIMAFFFGLGWGWLVLRSGSVVPAMISHYLVDCLGMIFLGVSSSNPIREVVYFLALTLIYPVLTILLTRFMYANKD